MTVSVSKPAPHTAQGLHCCQRGSSWTSSTPTAKSAPTAAPPRCAAWRRHPQDRPPACEQEGGRRTSRRSAPELRERPHAQVGFAPLDSTGSQLLFRFVAAAYERRSLAIASHWPFEEWGRFLPEHSTAVSLLDRLLHHNNLVATDGESYRMREARNRQGGRPTKR